MQLSHDDLINNPGGGRWRRAPLESCTHYHHYHYQKNDCTLYCEEEGLFLVPIIYRFFLNEYVWIEKYIIINPEKAIPGGLSKKEPVFLRACVIFERLQPDLLWFKEIIFIILKVKNLFEIIECD